MIWTEARVHMLEEGLKVLASEPRDVLLPICYSLPVRNPDSDALQTMIVKRLCTCCMYPTWLSRSLGVERDTLTVERVQLARMQWAHDLIIEGRRDVGMPLPEPARYSTDPHP